MKHTQIIGLALCATLLTASTSTQGAIESNFDDLVYPGVAGDGWVGGWQHYPAAAIPAIQTSNPIDGTTPYVRLDTTNTIRNFMRQFESGQGVNAAALHYIRWKFRLNEASFNANFSLFLDKVHFFGRNAKSTGGADASVNWYILAAGAAHTSGAIGGKTFWLFDNVDATGVFSTTNTVDTHVLLVPGNIYGNYSGQKSNQPSASAGMWRGGRVWRTNRHLCERACKAHWAAGFPIHGPEAGTLGMNGWPITA